jgi:CRISPR-associated endonuclease/helicase Cas3
MINSSSDCLLAKSYSGCAADAEAPAYARLLPHLRAVESAGESIVEAVGELILQQLALLSDVWLSRLRRGLKAACLCHDIGKANDGFQSMVRGKLSPKRQPIRHELLSALLLADKSNGVRAWALNLLSENGKYDDAEELLSCVIAAVGGHHLKLHEDWHRGSIALRDGGCGSKLQMRLTHPDLKSLFHEASLSEVCFSLDRDLLEKLRISFNFDSADWKDKLENEPEWWRFAAALKALTTAADVAGSAVLPEKGISPANWVRANLAIAQRVTAEKMNEVVAARLKGAKPRKFQGDIGDAKERVTLVEAGCGSGKTAAAYMWAATHAQGKKLIFCYPTTGTATEGYRGYVAETDIEAALIHSRADVDLKGVAEVKQDDENSEDQKRDHLLRIDSLRAWRPQVVICTADTVLALARNNRRGLYNSPAILIASFVFDELHAYDDRMFAAVIALIRALPGAHFLLMTASLPKARKRFLLEQIGVVGQVPKPRKLEKLPRYLFEHLPDRTLAYEKAKEAASCGLKVLWICNIVARAQEVFQNLRDDSSPVRTYCMRTYHSHFKYEDRVRQHRKIIRWFNHPKTRFGFIAVTTQVAEMSLDLDADVLISDIAPVPSLIQRLGRLNRRITPEKKGEPRTAYFLTPKSVSPYDESSIKQGLKWIKDLKELNRPLRQSTLAAFFNAMAADEEPRFNLDMEWLDSGWFAYPVGVRDASVTVSVILPEDERACREDPKELVKKEIPMNFEPKRHMQDWPEYKGRLIAPPNTIDYDKRRGARWL